MKVLITVSYCGTDYNGYQLQEDKPTVALMLNKSAEKTFGFPCKVTGCSRTDSKVHAIGFCATVEPKSKENSITVPTEKIPIAMNINLPPDISVTKAESVPDGFHPRYSVIKKEYVYLIHDSEIRNPFYRDKVLEYGRKISEDSLNEMREGALYLKGKHDFSSFMSAGSKIKSTERTIFDISIKRDKDLVSISICADGFLYNMVRIIVGTLLQIGTGRIKKEDIPDIIESKNRSKAGFTARPEGLYLKNVFYHY